MKTVKSMSLISSPDAPKIEPRRRLPSPRFASLARPAFGGLAMGIHAHLELLAYGLFILCVSCHTAAFQTAHQTPRKGHQATAQQSRSDKCVPTGCFLPKGGARRIRSFLYAKPRVMAVSRNGHGLRPVEVHPNLMSDVEHKQRQSRV